MNLRRRAGWTRIGVLITTVIVLLVLLVGGYFAHKLRKRSLVTQSLAQGLAAYDEQDWETARVKLGQYLSVHHDDRDVLIKYAEAQLAVRPLPPANVQQAIAAYRRVFRQLPGDAQVFRRLALLYEHTGNPAELGHIAETRLGVVPDDPAATLARCRDLIHRQKTDEARAALEPLHDRLMAQGEPARESIDATLLLCDVLLRSEAPDTTRQCLAALDEAAALNPRSAFLQAQRVALLRALAQAPDADADSLLADARAALEHAERLAASDPQALLPIARHCLALGEPERVPPLLDAAERLTHADLKDFVVDPRDWRTACFEVRADWLIATGQAAACLAHAEQGLADTATQFHELAILPTAVRLFLAGERVADARATLDRYVDRLVASGSAVQQSPGLALLQAMVAHAENHPYQVIALLEPLAENNTAPAGAAVLLSEAYARTGQRGRMGRVLGGAGRAPAAPVVVERLARLAGARGDWDRAENLLATLDPERRAAPDIALLELTLRLQRATEDDASGDDYARVIAQLGNLRDQHPERSDIRIVLALAENGRGDPAAAEAELRTAVDVCADPWPAYRALALLCSATQGPDAARAVLREACAATGERADPWLDLAARLEAEDDVPAARAALEQGLQAVAGPQERRRLQIQRAVLDVVHGEAEAGLAALQSLAAEDAEDIHLRAGLLEVPQILRDTATAQRLVDEIQAVEGETGVLWRLGQARLWLAQPHWQERQPAIEALLKYCLKVAPDQAAPVLLLGRMYSSLGQFAAAEAALSAGFQATGSLDVADALLAVLGRQRRFTEAQRLLEQLQRSAGPEALAARQLSLALESGRQDDAIAQLQLRTASGQRDPLDVLRLARLMYGRDRAVEPALAQLDEAATLGAAPAEVARARVAILTDAGRTAQAEEVLDQLVAAHPDTAAYLLRASYYAAAGRPERAAADYAKLPEIADSDIGYATLGEYHARAGDLDAAIAVWEEGLAANPESTTLRRGLCKALLLRRQEGDLTRVDHLLDDLYESLGADHAELLCLKALHRSAVDPAAQRDEIAELLDEAVHALPAGADTYVALAGLALDFGWGERARALALRGLELHPSEPILRLRQAQAEAAIGNTNVALDFARAVADQQPDSVQALALYLGLAAERGQQAALRDGLQRIVTQLREQPDHMHLQLLQADALLDLGQGATATERLEAFRTADERHNTLPVLLKMAQIHHAGQQYDAAWRYVEQATALAPADPGVVVARLRLLAAQQRLEEVVQVAQQYDGGDTPHPGVLLEAVAILRAVPAQRPVAIGLCQRAVELAPESATPLLQLGGLQYEQGDLDTARSAFERALVLAPDNPETLNNLAWVLGTDPQATDRQLEHARDYARQAVAQKPRNVAYRDTLAVILQKMPGELPAARTELEHCVALAPPDSPRRARALFQLAQVCERLGEREAVQQSLRDALAVAQTLASQGEQTFSDDEQQAIARMLAAQPD